MIFYTINRNRLIKENYLNKRLGQLDQKTMFLTALNLTRIYPQLFKIKLRFC